MDVFEAFACIYDKQHNFICWLNYNVLFKVMQSAVVDISKTDRYTMQLVRQGLILLGKYAWTFSIINYDFFVCE